VSIRESEEGVAMEAVVKTFGSYSDKKSKKRATIVDLESGKKELVMQNSDWCEDEPLYVESEDGKKTFVMINHDSFKELVKIVKKHQEEAFKLKLEKEILQSMPIDFDDVWVVAMNEIKKSAASNGKNVDTKDIIKNIKKSYPNLFFDMESFISGKIAEESSI